MGNKRAPVPTSSALGFLLASDPALRPLVCDDRQLTTFHLADLSGAFPVRLLLMVRIPNATDGRRLLGKVNRERITLNRERITLNRERITLKTSKTRLSVGYTVRAGDVGRILIRTSYVG